MNQTLKHSLLITHRWLGWIFGFTNLVICITGGFYVFRTELTGLLVEMEYETTKLDAIFHFIIEGHQYLWLTQFNRQSPIKMLQKEIKVQSNRAIKRPNLPPLLFNNYTLHTRYDGADFTRQVRCNILKNSEICTKEGAVCSTNSIAPFLHTRSFNILRRLGIGVKRKTSENQ